MAVIIDEDAAVQFTLNILEELPRSGFVDDGPVGLNSDGGLVKVLFQQTMGDETWLEAEILLLIESVEWWIQSVETLVADKPGNFSIGFDNMACPHLLLNVYKREWQYTPLDSDKPVTQAAYELFAGLSSMYMRGAGSWEVGPGILFNPTGEQLLAFAQQLRVELEAAAHHRDNLQG
jgi:hypothetical protein